MTPNEQLHALLQAFNDAVKKLVHDAVDQALKNAVVQKNHEDGYFSHYNARLQFDHPGHRGVVIQIGEPVKYESQSK